MEHVTITNMCMICDGTRVVVQDRVDPDWGGLSFPGGHVEAGESLTDAVIREMKEETGLTVFCPRLCGVKDWVNDDGSRYMALFYRTEQFEGTLTPSEEGRVFWMELEDMKRMPLAPGMDKMLRVFLEDNLSEYFLYLENGTWQESLK
ncbi:MAG: 8-oxo-dGTP diphosphatase [Clostridia bacterium]|nr:8-oxo-dGTP diphosphatase [Clostridia bacterium]